MTFRFGVTFRYPKLTHSMIPHLPIMRGFWAAPQRGWCLDRIKSIGWVVEKGLCATPALLLALS